MTLVFISYKRQDESFARELHRQIQSWGLQAWIDVIDIQPGKEWDVEIHQALKRCDVVIGLLTPESVISKGVLDEWGYADSNGKPLYLLWMQDVNEADIPPRYIRIQRIEFRSQLDSGLARLRDILHQINTSVAEYSASRDEHVETPTLTINDLAGQTYRGYRLFEQIGSGGYGVVYRARQVSIDREVAIKFILPEQAQRQEFINRFEAEAQMIARLEHPHIVPLYEFWRDSNTAYLVMRLMRRGSLRDVLTQHGPMALAHATRILDQIGDALTLAHQAGVIHRDLKPDNVMLDERGNAYLGDFGIATEFLHIRGLNDHLMGTPAYMAPEAIRGEMPTVQSDVYSFGVMIHELLLGKLPTGTNTLDAARPDMPDELYDVIEKATANDPSERYADISQLMRAYHAAADELLLTAAPSLVTSTLSQQVAGDTPSFVTPQRREQRNRRRMIQNVHTFWIKGVLENSLHGAALIELGMEEKLEAVDNPWDLRLKPFDAPEEMLPSGTRGLDMFDGMNGKMLILGDPGSGKTTTMLELARDLINRALKDNEHPIPVVLNLSSWADERKPLTGWLVDELNTKYQVARKIAEEWIESDSLLLMLDGLDEVDLRYREACVDAINTYRQDHGFVDVVVCSRILDYQALSTKLRLNGAIVLQPLDDDQINAYLTSLGAQMNTIRDALREDETLRELASTPLMLSIMALAYRGITREELPKTNDLNAYRTHLFDLYIKRMFERRMTKEKYKPEVVLRYLGWLASQLVQRKQTVFYIENLQMDWLPAGWQRGAYRIMHYLAYGGVIGGLAGLIGGAVIGLFFAVFEAALGLDLMYLEGFGLAANLAGIGAVTGGLIGITVFGLASVPALAMGTIDGAGDRLRDQIGALVRLTLSTGMFLLVPALLIFYSNWQSYYDDPINYSIANILGIRRSNPIHDVNAFLTQAALAGLVGVLAGALGGVLAIVRRRGWLLRSARGVFGLYGLLGGLILFVLFVATAPDSGSMGLYNTIILVTLLVGGAGLIGLAAGGYNDDVRVAESVGWRWSWRWLLFGLGAGAAVLLLFGLATITNFIEAWNLYPKVLSLLVEPGMDVVLNPTLNDPLFDFVPVEQETTGYSKAISYLDTYLVENDQPTYGSLRATLTSLLGRGQEGGSGWDVLRKEFETTFNSSLRLIIMIASVGALAGGIAGGLRRSETVEMRTRPNQGIRRTAVTAVRVMLAFGAAGALVSIVFSILWVIFAVNPDEDWRRQVFPFIPFGIGIGVATGLVLGGSDAVIKHGILRLFLRRGKRTPRGNYARLLDYAADRILLRKVGGGYIFIHRYLLEHFAARYQEQTVPKRTVWKALWQVAARAALPVSAIMVVGLIFVPLALVYQHNLAPIVTPAPAAFQEGGWSDCDEAERVPLEVIEQQQGQPVIVQGCITDQQSISAQLEQGQAHAYVFPLDNIPLSRMQFSVSESTPDEAGIFDPVVYLYNSKGELVVVNDESRNSYSYYYYSSSNLQGGFYFEGEMQRFTNDIYTIVIHEYRGKAGRYNAYLNLDYSEGNELIFSPTPTPVRIMNGMGRAVKGENPGTLPDGEGHVWEYRANAGEIVRIEVNAAKPANTASRDTRNRLGLLDTYVIVREPQGTIIAQHDDIEPSEITNSLLETVVFEETGDYSIEVSGYNYDTSGDYLLIISEPVASPLELTALFNGTATIEALYLTSTVFSQRATEIAPATLTAAVPTIMAATEQAQNATETAGALQTATAIIAQPTQTAEMKITLTAVIERATQRAAIQAAATPTPTP